MTQDQTCLHGYHQCKKCEQMHLDFCQRMGLTEEEISQVKVIPGKPFGQMILPMSWWERQSQRSIFDFKYPEPDDAA